MGWGVRGVVKMGFLQKKLFWGLYIFDFGCSCQKQISAKIAKKYFFGPVQRYKGLYACTKACTKACTPIGVQAYGPPGHSQAGLDFVSFGGGIAMGDRQGGETGVSDTQGSRPSPLPSCLRRHPRRLRAAPRRLHGSIDEN